jgi:glutamate N-acetyltransferase/amino-acid N-acetyltransferase
MRRTTAESKIPAALAAKMKANGLRIVPGGVTAPCGFEASAVRCGLKKRGTDLALIYSVAPAAGAGMFTTNRVQAAPVLVSKDRIGRGNLHGVVVNSGNANACTGPQGYHDAVAMAEQAAEGLGVPPRSMLVCSTGVIGHAMPMEMVSAGITKAVAALTPDGGDGAAKAILTTDTRPKSIAIEFELAGRPVRVGGMAKGAGMIAPHLATMLAFITTDADLRPDMLHACLGSAVEHSFNRVTVDGDTSTNDAVLLLVNRQAEAGQITRRRGLHRFQAALECVCSYLAGEIARDGEGATKLIEVRVRGAESERDALRIARTIANSPLVKTALGGGDPNWGRILAAAGRAGVRFRADLLELYLGKVRVVRAGAAAKYDLTAAQEAVAGPEVEVILDLHAGEHDATVWTCDLGAGYVKINAAYHT